MRKIYFQDRCICICEEQACALADPNSIEYHLNKAEDVTSLIAMLEGSNPLQRVYIPSKDPDATYQMIADEFKEVNAAGGLVRNRRGDCLLIRRSGLWDLPKGHQEEGEDIKVTAVREVQEETGLEDITAKDLLCVTDHVYYRNETWHLKHTWWYDMECLSPNDLIPQREEDITRVEWVAKASLPPYLKNSYASIVEVFRLAKI
ncbi:MAG: NUDIX domain-containing protein [Bacteroidales bacterium]|nr:NUDIX domain-containing protein [Bacteroidales bacterium]